MVDEISGSGFSRGQRARLTCTECYRRKIKCDKNVPCGTCLKRGIAHSCSREDAPVVDSALAQHPPAGPEGANDVLRLLMKRVADIETRLKSDQNNASPQLSSHEPPTPVSHEITERLVEETSSSANTTTNDTATVLEFLAWGRKKDVDFADSPDHDIAPGRSHNIEDGTHGGIDVLTESTKSAQLDVLEALLPNHDQIFQLVSYHSNSILWYHGSYSHKSFSNQLDTFLQDFGGNIRHEKLNIQWLALLFSILCGSIVCAPPSVRHAWGFSETETPSLCLRWYEATVSCLTMAEYTEIHTIYSVQAIATLTISAHIVGKSNTQSILLSAAGRIAQGLGLHRLDSKINSSSPERLRKIESGRRVFIQLCTQDWFQIPFSEAYTINPRFSSTAKPLNCNDDDMVIQPQGVPTQSSYCNFRYDIAALMPQLLDAMADSNTLFTKYEQVLKYDAKMRELATASIPTFLSTNAPVAVEWPNYVSWARRSLTICAAHKIIMIHRKFVGLSFTNTAFSFTRRTCIAASKTILNEALATNDEKAPVLWIEQAFAIAAGIILSLDAFHRTVDEAEFVEHRQLITDTMAYLEAFRHSKIASRGVKLLSALKQEFDELARNGSRKRTYSFGEVGTSPPHKRRAFSIQALVTNVSQKFGVTPPAATTNMETRGDILDNTWDAFIDLIPHHTELDATYLFDNILFNDL